MKKQLKIIGLFLLATFSLCFTYGQKKAERFPYKQSGLNKQQAAIHLLNRFTYGYNANDVRNIEKEGLEKWFFRQLRAEHPDDELALLLKPYADVMMDNQSIVKKYPRGPRVRRMMINEGFIPEDSVDTRSEFYKAAYQRYLQEKGFRPEGELFRKFIATKVLRAAFSANQLQEVMTDFWFNHFNVSFTKPQSAPYIPSYENHVIRPNALGKFEKLLLATTKSPAMLFFLDNASSTAEMPKSKNKKGINENYARELMELHTLGVDGGYTQRDVSEAARILTGWTVYPMNGYGNPNLLKNLTTTHPKIKNKNIVDGDFIFIANRHDKGKKVVLGRLFEDDGYNEGVDLISYLSTRSQTANFICKKIATRFVNDHPDDALIAKMANIFLKSEGDIKEVLTTMVYSPEFWEEKNIYNKIKTPFELAISTVRALDGRVENPNRLINWVTRMGEKKYYYIAPTGFPDQSDYWINTGSVLNRMNFGLVSISNNAGINVDLLALTGHRKPENVDEALEVFARLLLPTADMTTLKSRLSPLLTTQNLQQKIERSSNKAFHTKTDSNKEHLVPNGKQPNNTMLTQVVGLIIGSPEFQRR